MNIILFGGTGEVGQEVARELINSSFCSSLTMIGRRSLDTLNHPKVTQIIVDPGSADFENSVAKIAKGHDAGICCIGIGSGTYKLTEEQMAEVEVGMTGKFARGCKAAGIEIFELLTAVGINESTANSRLKYTRVIGKKYKIVLDTGFKKLAVFKPGMIVGNKHTPKWMTFFTAIIPDFLGWGNIHKKEIARAFVAHLEKKATEQTETVVSYENKDMKQLIF